MKSNLSILNNVSSSKHNSVTFLPADMVWIVLVKRTYKNCLNNEFSMENTPSWTPKVLKIMESISCVSGNAVIASLNKARWSKPAEKPSDVDEDEVELIELEHSQLEESDEQSIKVSDD